MIEKNEKIENYIKLMEKIDTVVYSNEFFSKEDNYENDIRKVFEENETYPTDDIVY